MNNFLYAAIGVQLSLAIGCMKGGYKSIIVYNMVRMCVSQGGSIEGCACFADKTQSRISEKEFIEAEMILASSGKIKKRIARALLLARRECKKTEVPEIGDK